MPLIAVAAASSASQASTAVKAAQLTRVRGSSRPTSSATALRVADVEGVEVVAGDGQPALPGQSFERPAELAVDPGDQQVDHRRDRSRGRPPTGQDLGL